MSNMKHLMIFEAFESNALSKTMKFLLKKTDSNSRQLFTNKLKNLIEELDIPIDKIKDKDVKYLNRFQAIKLKNESDVDNDTYCFKFWFSIEDGYLGFTGTGNLKMDFNKYIKDEKNRNFKNEEFSNKDLNYIKNDLDIKTGILKPVKDYPSIQHGQLVIGIFSDDHSNINRLGLSKIWRDNDHLFAIQNVASGGEPSSEVDGQSWQSWRDENPIFRSSWSLDSVNSPGRDHCKLHIYTPSDEPLKLEGHDKKEVKEIESPFDYNLPVSRNYKIREWGDTDWSINSYTLIDKSDFAIVLMIDDILKSDVKKVTDVKKSREESKEGATKLMSDSQIKEANIKRYLSVMIYKMGIDLDVSNLQNLQKLITKSICDDFAFISIRVSRPGFDYIDYILSNIYEMMNSVDNDTKKYFLNRAVDNYKDLNYSYLGYMKYYNSSLSVIKNINSEEIINLFEIFMKIGEKIKNYLRSQNIKSIEDLRMVIVKLESIRTLLGKREFRLSSNTRNMLDDFNNKNDITYYSRNVENEKENLLFDINIAKNLERYVDSLLR